MLGGECLGDAEAADAAADDYGVGDSGWLAVDEVGQRAERVGNGASEFGRYGFR